MRHWLLQSTLLLSACNTEKIAQLEKQNKELAAKLESASKSGILDLQEKCAKQARELFKSDGWEKEKMASFTNHYNQRLNKCFVQVESTHDGTWTSTFVADAFEGKGYGQYYWESVRGKKYWEVPPFRCKVMSLGGEETDCHSDEEFKTAMKQYME